MTAGLESAGPSASVAGLLAMAVSFAALVLFIFFAALVHMWACRRFLRGRKATAKVLLAEIIAALAKRSMVAAPVRRTMFFLSPVLAILAPVGASALVPLGPDLCLRCMDTGLAALPFRAWPLAFDLLLWWALMFIPGVAWLWAGWSAQGKWSMMAGIRSMGRTMAAHTCLGVVLVAVILMNGHTDVFSIVTTQGAWPWEWNVFSLWHLPAFLTFVGLQLVLSGQGPFEIEHPHGVEASPWVEHSGLGLSLLRASATFTAVAGNMMAVSLFLGGGRVPQSLFDIAPGLMLAAAPLVGFCLFLVKVAVLMVAQIFVLRHSARVTVVDILPLMWRYWVPASAGCLIVSLVHLWWLKGGP